MLLWWLKVEGMRAASGIVYASIITVFLFRIYWISSSFGAMFCCLWEEERRNQAIYYANIALGRLEGAIGWTFFLAKSKEKLAVSTLE